MNGVFPERRRSRPAEHGESRAFLAAIVESSDDSIIGTDLSGCILSWNGGAERLFGYTAEEAQGRHINMLFPEAEQNGYRSGIERILREERVERFESVRVSKGGVAIDVSVILSPVKDRLGRLQGVSGIYRDISQRKSAQLQLLRAKQAAEAANQAKSDFLANMSHEIRTPMNGILGMTEVLLDSDLNGEQREQLQIIKSSAESLLTILSDTLDFAMIEANRLIIEPSPFDLRPVLDALMEEMSRAAVAKKLEFRFLMDKRLPDRITGDAARLRQVLVNLIGNAVKFTAKGKVEVALRVLREDPRLLWFTVTDTGPGIPLRKQKAVFEAFRQLDGSRTRKFGGTGLGLALASRLVRMMGGRIWLESDGRSGSSFHFTTPRA